MPHPALLQRLESIHRNILAVYDAGASFSSASKGSERENFVREFLEQILPPPYRFGHGDIIGYSYFNPVLKEYGHDSVEYGQSGQVDIIIEYPFYPALKPLSQHGPRLYLAEGVAAVIEVKSDLSGQWDEVCASARKVKSLERHFTGGVIGRMPAKRIPFYAVGYKGWKNVETLAEKLEGEAIDGALILDPCLFSGTLHGRAGWAITGYPGLWALISLLIEDTTQLVSYCPQLMNYLSNFDSADHTAITLLHAFGVDCSPDELRGKSPEAIRQLVTERKQQEPKSLKKPPSKLQSNSHPASESSALQELRPEATNELP